MQRGPYHMHAWHAASLEHAAAAGERLEHVQQHVSEWRSPTSELGGTARTARAPKHAGGDVGFGKVIRWPAACRTSGREAAAGRSVGSWSQQCIVRNHELLDDVAA